MKIGKKKVACQVPFLPLRSTIHVYNTYSHLACQWFEFVEARTKVDVSILVDCFNP
jgi:hypothetical protein